MGQKRLTMVCVGIALFAGVSLLAIPSAHAVPVLQVGVADGTSYVPNTASQTIVVNGVTLGTENETAFASGSPFTLALAGQYADSGKKTVVSLGGNFAGTEINNKGVSIPFYANWADFTNPGPNGVNLGFLDPTKGAVLLVTVPEGAGINGLGITGLNGALDPILIASQTGSLGSGFNNNHFPTGNEDLFDYFYFDLGSMFLDLPGAVPNMQDSKDASKDGEVRFYKVDITDGLAYAHFDLMAIQVTEEIGSATVTNGIGKKKTASIISTVDYDATQPFNPPSHDASWYPPPPPPIPEPGTMILLGSGLVGLAGWGRKRFRK